MAAGSVLGGQEVDHALDALHRGLERRIELRRLAVEVIRLLQDGSVGLLRVRADQLLGRVRLRHKGLHAVADAQQERRQPRTELVDTRLEHHGPDVLIGNVEGVDQDFVALALGLKELRDGDRRALNLPG
ncbi:MAG TPA: hypothetical protein VK009_22785 [Chloroflexota bacterium]|nr:hypothetical protein [Chloroflexota bacterium]